MNNRFEEDQKPYRLMMAVSVCASLEMGQGCLQSAIRMWHNVIRQVVEDQMNERYVAGLQMRSGFKSILSLLICEDMSGQPAHIDTAAKQ